MAVIITNPPGSGGAGITDGDKGDINVASTGSMWTIKNEVITGDNIVDGSIPAGKLQGVAIIEGDTGEDFVLRVSGDVTMVDAPTFKAALDLPTAADETEFIISMYGVSDGAYSIDPKASGAYTVLSSSLKTLSGTATASIRINSTNVTGLDAQSLTTSFTNVNASAANAVVANDDLNIIFSSITGTVNVVGKVRIRLA